MTDLRIREDMSPSKMIIALSDGDPEAIVICTEILQKGKKVDPYDFLAGLSNLLDLDTLNIYGLRICLFWDSVCNKDAAKLIAVLRAYQLGQLAGVTKETINHAINNQGEGIDLEEVCKQVTKKLPNFKLDVAA